MSRIGKQVIVLPQGVKVGIAGDVVSIEGPRGKLQYAPGKGVSVKCEGGKVQVLRDGQDKQSKANWGTARAHINNMVHGVTKGWKRSLELVGVGYTAKLEGQRLTLAVGKSHEEMFQLPAIVKGTVGKTSIELESIDRELLGTLAAKIRKSQPPEPYLGKGVKYNDEHVRRKAGKAGKK